MSGWNHGITHSLTVAGMLRVLVSALGSIKTKPKACYQHSTLRGKLSTFFTSVCTGQIRIHQRKAFIKSLRVYLGNVWANLISHSWLNMGNSFLLVHNELYLLIQHIPLKFLLNLSRFNKTDTQINLKQAKYELYFNAGSIIDLFAVMHLEVTMLSSYLPGIPWEEMELKETSGLILSDPGRLKFNHPPHHHYQIAHLIQPCPSCDHISFLWLVCVVSSIVGGRIWVIPEQEFCLQILLVIRHIWGQKLGIQHVPTQSPYWM